ncbi:MAG: hypothetical protein Q9174_002305, partial [Haloplaca sp. 1 TL-2023]
MPSAVTPTRRSREASFDEEETEPSNAAGKATKRARLNLNGDVAPGSQSPVLANGHTSNGRNGLQEEILDAQKSRSKHQKGSIVRVKLVNFVTYTAAEFLPGPSLNMVIGPNGTGKSTLVCAICLGLGWGPQHLGRAKDVSEFVKHGEQEAEIEIELAGDPKRHRRNPVIKCNIKRENNKSTFFIDGKASNKKAVIELCRSFTIQIDNLCQFLPQDKVVEFAAMTPVELLRSTQRAVAPQEMIDMHEELKEHRHQQKSIQAKVQGDEEALQNLENRQRMQADDVQRMRDREVIKERIRLMESSRPFIAYRGARKDFGDSKEKKAAVKAELDQLRQDVEPSMRAVNTKKAYQQQIELVSNERKRMVQNAERDVDKLDHKLGTMHERKGELEAEVQAEKNAGKDSRKDIVRLEQNIVKLKRQIADPPPDTDISGYNERIREKNKAVDDAGEKITELQRSKEDIAQRGKDKKNRILQAQRDLENLESQAGQQENKLRQSSYDTWKAWDWIKQNQGEFEQPVYGPPIVECSVTDLNYVDQIETLIQRTQMLTITCQTNNDFKKLGNILHDRLHLAEVNMQNMAAKLDQFQPPVPREELSRYGLTGWALDYVKGPEPVMAMLCANVRLHQTGMADRDTTPEHFDLLQNGPIENWVTKKSSYKIARRREYGPSATSTNVRDIKKAQIWTNQPVDTRAKRDLQENIEGWQSEVAQMKTEYDDANTEVTRLRNEVRDLQAESRDLQQEKAQKQKVLSEFKALPVKLEQQERKLADAQHILSDLRQRLNTIAEKQTQLTHERAETAFSYATAIETLSQRHQDLHEAEIMLLESTSDLASILEKNASVESLLASKREESDRISEETARVGKVAKELCEHVKRVMESADEALRAHWQTLSVEQTGEELEEEIESEKA